MEFEAFEAAARAAYQEIPDAFKEGVGGLVVTREALAHPEHPDVFTLGHCLTEDHPSDYGSPDTTRSVIALYWGSFRQLARRDPSFDWDEELWETLPHELRHHLESLADEDALEAMDYAVDESFKRERGEPFDPWYFQWGEPVGEGVYRVEEEVYIERVLTEEEFGGMDEIEFTWRGRSYRLPRPREQGDVHFIVVEGTEPFVQIVLVRRASWRRRLGGVLGSRGPTVLESGGEARQVAPNGDEVR